MSEQQPPSTDPLRRYGAASATTDGRRGSPEAIVTAITDVSDRVQTLVREEIELAKLELTEKAKRAAVGAAVAVSAGVFAFFAAMLAAMGFAWLLYWVVPVPTGTYFWGFFMAAAILLLIGAFAGFIAARAIRRAVPPAPQMAIDEAKLIRETMRAQQPEATVPTSEATR